MSTDKKPNRLFIAAATIGILAIGWFGVTWLEKKTDSVLVQYEDVDGYIGNTEDSQSHGNEVAVAVSPDVIEIEPEDVAPSTPEQPSEPEGSDTAALTPDAPTGQPEAVPSPEEILSRLEYLGRITSASLAKVGSKVWKIKFGINDDIYLAFLSNDGAEYLGRIAFKYPVKSIVSDSPFSTAVVWLFIENMEPIQAIDLKYMSGAFPEEPLPEDETNQSN